MMRVVKAFLVFTITFLSLFSIDTAAQSFAPAAGQSRSVDEQIYRKLKGLPNYNVFDNITWTVNGGTVTLTGKVYTLSTRSEAAKVVKDIPGVTAVINNIEDLPPSPMDDRIRIAAYREFNSRGPSQYFGYPNPDVRIIVENGRITLEGYVARRSDSDTLNILANGIPNVFSVKNNLIVGERRF